MRAVGGLNQPEHAGWLHITIAAPTSLASTGIDTGILFPLGLLLLLAGAAVLGFVQRHELRARLIAGRH